MSDVERKKIKVERNECLGTESGGEEGETLSEWFVKRGPVAPRRDCLANARRREVTVREVANTDCEGGLYACLVSRAMRGGKGRWVMVGR